jgi:hypothetical protein
MALVFMSFPGIWGRVRKEESNKDTKGRLNADRSPQLKAIVGAATVSQ